MGLLHFYLFSPTESVISIFISQILNCIFSTHFDDPLAKKSFSLSFLLHSLPLYFYCHLLSAPYFFRTPPSIIYLLTKYCDMTPESAILSDDMALFTTQLGKTKFEMFSLLGPR